MKSVYVSALYRLLNCSHTPMLLRTESASAIYQLQTKLPSLRSSSSLLPPWSQLPILAFGGDQHSQSSKELMCWLPGREITWRILGTFGTSWVQDSHSHSKAKT